MEEMPIIPKKEVTSDVQYYKDELTGNAWLNRAEELAAQKKRILQDPTLSDEIKVQRVKPVSQQFLKANKRLRQIPSMGSGGGGGEDEEDDADDLVSTNIEKWLKRLAKNVQTPRTPTSTARSPATTPRRFLPARPKPRPPSTLTTLGTPTTSRPVEKDLIRFDGDDVAETPKKTLTRSMLDGAIKGLTGGTTTKKKKESNSTLSFHTPTNPIQDPQYK